MKLLNTIIPKYLYVHYVFYTKKAFLETAAAIVKFYKTGMIFDDLKLG